MRLWLTAFLGLALAVAANGQRSQPSPDNRSAEFHAMQQKLDYLKQNAAKPHRDPKPVELTEPEVNAYFNEGGVKLPKGVSRLHLTSRPSVIDAHATVDFEEIMQERGPSNPLYSLFSGTHDVHAVAQATGANGTGSIRGQSIELDGVQIPQFAVEWFVQHYLAPKYSTLGVTATFKLPLRIDSTVVESNKARLVQRRECPPLCRWSTASAVREAV